MKLSTTLSSLAIALFSSIKSVEAYTNTTTPSSSSSVPSASSTLTPWIEGFNDGGKPRFNIFVPLELGPWDSIEFISLAQTENFGWVPASSEFFLGSSGSYPYVVSSGFTDDSTTEDVDTTLNFFDDKKGQFDTLKFVTPITNPKSATGTFTVTFAVSLSNGASKFRRDDTVYYLTGTYSIVSGLSSSSSVATSGLSSSSSVVTSGLSSSSSVVTSGLSSSSSVVTSGLSSSSTAVTSGVNYVSGGLTTYVTTTCTQGKCVATTVTAKESAYTTTISGSKTVLTDYYPLTGGSSVLTTYTTTRSGVQTVVTTYCPTTNSNATATTIVTTTCVQDKCVKATITTGLTTYATTQNGVKTVVTTYCPLASAAAGKTTVTSTFIASKSTTIRSLTCPNGACSQSTYVTGVTSYQTTGSNGLTSYVTTYCPLSTVITSVYDVKSTGYSVYTPVITISYYNSSSTVTTGTTTHSGISTYQGAAAASRSVIGGALFGGLVFLGALVV